MSFDSLLRHRVLVIRQAPVLDAGEPTYTERGMPITEPEPIATIRCRIQPLTLRELDRLAQSGAVVGTHRIFARAGAIRTGDTLVPQPADGRAFEVEAIEDAGGSDHHVEVLATLTEGPEYSS